MPNTDITPVELLTPERRKLDSSPDREREKRQATRVELPAEFIKELERQRAKMQALTTTETLQRAFNTLTDLLPVIFTILTSYYMGNWKTTVSAVVTALVSIGAHFGFDVSAEVQGVIISVGLIFVGFFAKDKPTTEETVPKEKP